MFDQATVCIPVRVFNKGNVSEMLRAVKNKKTKRSLSVPKVFSFHPYKVSTV